MALQWSEPRKANAIDSHYDYIVAETPLGRIFIEWKSWKSYDSPGCQMPWGDYVNGHDLDDAKANVQTAWNAMAKKMADLAT